MNPAILPFILGGSVTTEEEKEEEARPINFFALFFFMGSLLGDKWGGFNLIGKIHASQV